MDDLLSIAVSNAVAATVLALAAIVVGTVYRRPALMHGLWLLVLLKLVTPPLVFLPISWPTPAEPPPAQAVNVHENITLALAPAAEERAADPVDPSAEREEPAPAEAPVVEDALDARTRLGSTLPSEPPLWPQILSILWAAGALAWFLLALERLHHFRRLLRFARPAPAALQGRTRWLAHSLGLRRCPRVRLLPGRIAPMLWAAGGSPRLLVPADLLAGLSEEQLDTLLVHELAHLRRRDHWVRIVEFVVLGLYWWHPVVWYARRELREAEEQCCDAWVVSTLPGAGRTYASALLDTLDFLSTTPAAVPPLASGLGQIADLKRRLTMIMRGNTPRSLTWPGCLAVVVLGLTFLPMLPSLHGQAPAREEDQSKSVDRAKKNLDEAKARLEYAKAQLEVNKAHLELAAEQLKAAHAQHDIEAVKWQRKATVLVVEQIAQKRENKPKIRIEIVLEGEDINVSELTKKLKDVLPQKNVNITINKDGGRIFEVRPKDPNAPGNAPVRSQIDGKPSFEFRLTNPGGDATKRNPSGDPEKRIDELEKKLEKVLQELRDMRKEMKPTGGRPGRPVPLPRGGNPPPRPATSPPAGPTPPAEPASAAAPTPPVNPASPDVAPTTAPPPPPPATPPAQRP